MTEKYEYCSAVPRTFVQDCSYLGVGELELTFFFPFSWTFSQFYSSSLKHVEVSIGVWRESQGPLFVDFPYASRELA